MLCPEGEGIFKYLCRELRLPSEGQGKLTSVRGAGISQVRDPYPFGLAYSDGLPLCEGPAPFRDWVDSV